MPASQHSCVATGVVPGTRGPDNGVKVGKQGVTRELVFRNFNLTATVVRMGGSRAETTWGAGLHSTQPDTVGTQEMRPKETKRILRTALSGGGTGLAASQPGMRSQFGDFFQL